MPWVVAGIMGLIALACGADAQDERAKRRAEEERFRNELARLSEQLASKEQQLEMLRVILGEKNHQVRILAAEVEALRAELWNAQCRAA